MATIAGDNIQDAIRNYLETVPLSARLARHHLMLANQDGICLFSNRHTNTEAALGALLGGVWQASKALMELHQHNKNNDFKLGFDDGSSGFCVVDFYVADKPCYACLMFEDEIAPSALRGQLRHWCDELALQLKSWRAPNKRGGFLFKDVTDEEIDRLFGFEGNACRS